MKSSETQGWIKRLVGLRPGHARDQTHRVRAEPLSSGSGFDGVFFDHIPKCCGSSLNEMFREVFGPNSVAPTQLGEQARIAKRFFTEYSVVSGHFGGRIFEPGHDDIFYCTLIRDPVDRALSTFYYFQQLPNNAIPQVESIRQMSLDEFAESTAPAVEEILNNPLTRHFAEAAGYTSDLDDVSAVWDAALSALDSYHLVGVCETFEQSINELFRRMGRSRPKESERKFHANPTPKRKQRKEIPEDILGRIRARNTYDLALYKAAQARLTDSPADEVSGKLPDDGRNRYFTPKVALKDVVLSNRDSANPTLKTGEVLDVVVDFNLLEDVERFWYMVQVRDIYGDILYGALSTDELPEWPLNKGSHRLQFALSVNLNYGEYDLAVKLGARPNDPIDRCFGNYPSFATPEPVARFAVLGNLGPTFYGKQQMACTANID